MREEAIVKIQRDELFESGCSLYAFIAYYMEKGRYDLIKKLGFNYRKFKESGGELFPTSLEIDFNHPVNSTNELTIKISLLNIYGSHVRIESKIYNQNYSLVANAISSFNCVNTKMIRNDLNLKDYFESMEENIEECVTY